MSRKFEPYGSEEQMGIFLHPAKAPKSNLTMAEPFD
jgi:hypothetical protein